MKSKSKADLKKLLYKLGIKSAGIVTLQEQIENMMTTVMESYGKPNQLFMSGSALEAMLDVMSKEDK